MKKWYRKEFSYGYASNSQNLSVETQMINFINAAKLQPGDFFVITFSSGPKGFGPYDLSLGYFSENEIQ